MRRMNYDRFAKPVNFGEYDYSNGRFLLDKPLEEGFYSIVIIDSEEAETSTASLFITDKTDFASSTVFKIFSDDSTYGYIEVSKEHRQYAGVYDINGNHPEAHDGLIIKLYKLD